MHAIIIDRAFQVEKIEAEDLAQKNFRCERA